MNKYTILFTLFYLVLLCLRPVSAITPSTAQYPYQPPAPSGDCSSADYRPSSPYVDSAGLEIAPWPTFEWSVSTPQEQGMDPASLFQAFDYGIAHNSKALLVIRHGYIVAEWYGEGWDADTRQTGNSVAKSFTSALVGMLIEDGSIKSVNDSVALYLPKWADTSHAPVTVRNLLSMDSGLHEDENTDFLLHEAEDKNAFALSLPMDHYPGRMWRYNSAATQVFSKLILNVTGMQPHEYARIRLADRIGMWNAVWLTDKMGNTKTYESVIASAQEFAKFGYLYLRGGEWDGEQIVPRRWVIESTRPSQSRNPAYGYLWKTNLVTNLVPDVPRDAFMAYGGNQKRIYVIGSQDIVAVRLGDPDESWDDNDFLGKISASVLPNGNM